MFRVRKVNEEKQIVYGEVYAPNVVDTWGEMMLPEDVELLAHRFMQHSSLKQSIDLMHDNTATDCIPVESFIARGMEGYSEGAWVLGVHIPNADLWEDVKKGDYNGFSFEAFVMKQAAQVELLIQPEVFGETEPADDGHTHLFFVTVNDDGKIVGGRTSTTNGHAHNIKRGTATEESSGHSHRIFV